MFQLPISITIAGRHHPIRLKGDFRMVLDCFEALNDAELDDANRVFTALIIFYDGMRTINDVQNTFGDNIKTAVTEMFNFFSCGQADSPTQKNYKLVDWSKDEQLIASAVNAVAGREIRLDEYLHWWTFMGYYMAIGECSFSNIVSIRSKIKSGKKLEKYERDFKKDNPQYFVWDDATVADKEADDFIRNLWNTGG